METTRLPGESDAGVIARHIAAELDGASDDRLKKPMVLFGSTAIVMVGPHQDGGVCWCQPTQELVTCTNLHHDQPCVHRVIVHDDRVH